MNDFLLVFSAHVIVAFAFVALFRREEKEVHDRIERDRAEYEIENLFGGNGK